jgi:ubiquinone biosynthesis protein
MKHATTMLGSTSSTVTSNGMNAHHADTSALSRFGTTTSPEALVKRGWRSVIDGLSLIASLPKDLSRLLRSARRGRLQIQVEVLPLKHFGEKIDRAVSRLSLSIITAALIIGSAIVANSESNSSSTGLSTLGLLGFIAAASGGIWVLISIWRSGKD